MLTVFLDMKGIVHCEFVPLNATVNSDFHCNVLRCLRENVQRKRPELWRNHNWLPHHDNASTVRLKRGKNDGIPVYVPKDTISKEMAAKIE
jgi:hypothetical protein